jgi:hypothetical protein
LLLALALTGCAVLSPVPFEPHLDWASDSDADWATGPALGVAPFADLRSSEARAGARPTLGWAAFGVAREGTLRTGDADFDRPIAEGVREELLATLSRSGAFASLTAVAFDPRVASAWPADAPALVLTGVVEEFEGRQWRSVSVSPLSVGFVRERLGPAEGRVSLRVELWSRAGREFEARLATRRESADADPGRAALEALAQDAEKLALRLDARLAQPQSRTPRALAVRVLDGCDLGESRVRRLATETSAIFEREAAIVLAASWEHWTPPAVTSPDALLAAVETLPAPANGVVLALAPAQQVRELALTTVRTGLSEPLGAHALALCPTEEEGSVLTAAHELAHLFGAVHVRERASIMHATNDFDARFFDPLNRRILRSQRLRDFSRPPSGETAESLAAIYRAAAHDSETVDERELDSALRALDVPGAGGVR